MTKLRVLKSVQQLCIRLIFSSSVENGSKTGSANSTAVKGKSASSGRDLSSSPQASSASDGTGAHLQRTAFGEKVTRRVPYGEPAVNF